MKVRPLLPLFLILFFFGDLAAQDTLIVQTFDWESDTRSGLFQFPDDPGQSFHKVLMRYNMRCHDAAVGNGNVGCREWDYSCNTFITAPELTDSTRAFHPTHLIPGFSGNSFDYTSQPVYAFTRYDQAETQAADPALVETTPFFQGASALVLNANQGTGKVQYLFRADELAAAGLMPGPVKGIQLELGGQNATLGFLRIRLKTTLQTELSAGAPETEGFSEVYFKNTEVNGDGPVDFFFSEPFDWNGTANLLLELSFTGGDNAPPVTAAGGQSGTMTSLFSLGRDHCLGFYGYGAMAVPEEAFAGVSQEITIALWTFGLPDFLPVNSSIFEGTDAAGRRQTNVHLPWGNGRVYWDCGNDGSGYDRIEKDATPDLYEGQWRHWAFTKNATTGEMKIFLDGQLWHSGTGKTRPIDIRHFLLGANALGGNPHYGLVDDLQIWDKALDEATIADWRFRQPDASHPDFDHLMAWYPFREGTGTSTADHSPNGRQGTLYNAPAWREIRGKDFFKGFTAGPARPNLGLLTGAFSVTADELPVVDSTLRNPFAVISFEVNETNDLTATDTAFLWPATETFLTDEAGHILETIPVESEGTIGIGELTYYQKQPAKLELLSFVTPYGNGLDLGPEGKTWFFDVTDYAPVLRGERRLSIEMGGQWQEELDIQFWFITGTPPREVIAIQNIWPFRRGGYAAIQNDQMFEPRTLRFREDAQMFKLRASITGHEQNGEFTPRNHYLSLEDGAIPFQFQVWKECGRNPVYPQGGTWIFDRAGWCPGMPTDVHEFEITDLVSPGQNTVLDYGVLGSDLPSANYLVSGQLVSYGAPNFSLDAAVVDIVRPTSRVEFERFNPACTDPEVIIQNTGATDLTSLTIEYGMRGGATATYEWSGNLYFLETETVRLPIPGVSFFETTDPEKVFEVRISTPNGGADEYVANNYAAAETPELIVFDVPNLTFRLRTNNRAGENRYSILDGAGQIVFSRQNLSNATTYEDELDLPPGCYTLKVVDTGDDGLDFWYWAAIGQNVGVGNLGFRRAINDVVSIPVYTIEPDFGGDVQLDFVIPAATAAADLEQPRRLSLFPNPTPGLLTLELEGFDPQPFEITLLDGAGRTVYHEAFRHAGGTRQFDLSRLPAGFYVLRLRSADKVWTRQVVIGR